MSVEMAPRIVLLGEFGCGNIGNDGSLATIVDHLRRTRPEWDIVVLARDAEVIREDFGLTAFDLSHRPMRGIFGKVLGRIIDPFRYARRVAGTEAVVVPGMGILEGELGEHAMGVPYFLFLFGVICRIMGVPFILLASGVSPLASPPSRVFARIAMRAAAYRSFRDEYSRRCALGMGFADPDDRAFCDIAFAMDVDDREPHRRGNVGVGVMEFRGRHPDADAGVAARARTRYVQQMEALCQGILSTGRQPSIFYGDQADLAVAHELSERLVASLYGPGCVTVVHATDFKSIVDAMAEVDLVIAARYHNIIAGVLAGRPLIGLAYAEKSSDLVRMVALADSAIDLDHVDASVVLGEVEACFADYDRVHARAQEGRSAMHITALEQLAALDDLLDRARTRRKRAFSFRGPRSS